MKGKRVVADFHYASFFTKSYEFHFSFLPQDCRHPPVRKPERTLFAGTTRQEIFAVFPAFCRPSSKYTSVRREINVLLKGRNFFKTEFIPTDLCETVWQS